MKKNLLVVVFLFGMTLQAQNQDVQKTIETFFEGFHAKDTAKIHSVCADKIILQSIAEGSKGTRLTKETTKEFYISIATMPRDMVFQEKILSYNIQVDGAMAHVWTPYEFFLNGKLSHRGVNAFTLFKENGSWKIIYLIDTRRK